MVPPFRFRRELKDQPMRVAIDNMIPVGRSHQLLMRLVATLIVAGLLSVPATCVEAAGPHSMFADPATLAMDTDKHALHRAMIAKELVTRDVSTGTLIKLTQPGVFAAKMAAASFDQDATVDDLPEPGTVQATVVAVMPDISTLLLNRVHGRYCTCRCNPLPVRRARL